jgi:hypothetical protein
VDAIEGMAAESERLVHAQIVGFSRDGVKQKRQKKRQAPKSTYLAKFPKTDYVRDDRL